MKKFLFGFGAVWLVALFAGGTYSSVISRNAASSSRVSMIVGLPAVAFAATPQFTPVLFRKTTTATATPFITPPEKP